LKARAADNAKLETMDAPRTTKDFAKGLRRRMSLPEVLLWKAIKGRKLNGLQFRKQHPIGPYVLDFYCDAWKLAIEVDGGSHSFGDRPVRDERRDAWLLERGVRTLRLSASLILEDVDDATRTIVGHLDGGNA
jgi:very-short-patch-repair endonuclease